MLEYDKIDMSKGIDVKETKSSRECIKYHSWYFLKVNFRFQPKVCDGSHVLMQKVYVLIMLQLFLLKEIIIEFLVYEYMSPLPQVS